jgi:recombination protein RecT
MSNQLALTTQFDEKQLETIKNTIAKGTTNDQFSLFVQTCQSSGLNPFLNHIHCIVYNSEKYGPQMSIQIAVEGIQYLARRTEGYKGIETQLVHENDEIKFGRDQNGNLTVTTHEFGFPRGQVVGGYSIARREGFPDVTVVMEKAEVEHMLKGRNAAMWKDWFNDMFKKHITKRAAKLQYGIEIAEDEAVGSQSSLDAAGSYNQRQRVDMGDITPDPKPIVTGETTVIDPAEEMEKQWAKIKGQTDLLGWKDASIKQFISDRFSKKPKDLSLQELVGLSKLLEFEISSLEKKQQQKPNGADSIFDAI